MRISIDTDLRADLLRRLPKHHALAKLIRAYPALESLESILRGAIDPDSEHVNVALTTYLRAAELHGSLLDGEVVYWQTVARFSRPIAEVDPGLHALEAFRRNLTELAWQEEKTLGEEEPFLLADVGTIALNIYHLRNPVEWSVYCLLLDGEPGAQEERGTVSYIPGEDHVEKARIACVEAAKRVGDAAVHYLLRKPA